MRSDTRTVWELQSDHVLRVEDGNHGEYRPQRGEFSDAGVAFIRAADVREGTVDFAGADKINSAAMARIRKGIGQPGDLILTHKGTVGRVARAPVDAPPFVCSPQTTFWRVLEPSALDRDYLFAFLRSPLFARQLAARQHETDMAPYVSLTAQRELAVPIPPISEQKAIGSVVRALDDKIDSNRRLAGLLEQIAQTEFQARFVDFVSESLGDGETPSGWQWRPMSALARYVNGKAFTKFGNGRGRMVIRIADLKSGPSASTVYTDYQPVDDDFVARVGDILFAWSGSLDVYRWYRDEALINQHIFKVIPDGVPQWIVYFSLKAVMPQFQAIAADKATTMGHIKRSDLARFSVAVPPAEELQRFDSVFAPNFDHSLTAVLEAETLTSIRDALLPRLISGRIRVPDTSDPGEAIEPLVDEEA